MSQPTEVSSESLPAPHAAAPGSILAAYRPAPGGYDELMDAAGVPRPHWREFIAFLDQASPGEIARRCGMADRTLAEAGVFYRIYGERGGLDRPWPLSSMPLILDEQEWEGLSRGLVQRAELLEVILADLYGAGRLVEKGVLPAPLVAGNAEYLRPLVGVAPRGGHYLHVYAADLGRGPDGRWWVLSDRTQAPSGAGYAVEDRLAVSRAFPELYRNLNVKRVAGFFRAFRLALSGLSGEGSTRVGLITPGPLNETYFEHAYLARYLGLLLLEGGDLVARGGRLLVKTVAGLAPIDVLWRRVDADFMDPLELNTASVLGVAGLVNVARKGAATFVNALGSGLLEMRGLMSFMPALSRHIRQEELILPNIATWWCGHEVARHHVLENLDAMLVAPAMNGFDGGAKDEAVLAADLTPDQRDALRGRIESQGQGMVGQEVVRLSTMPVWTGAGIEPRPFVLRVFLARTAQGWSVMPGGFVRVSEKTDTRAYTMQKGGQAADAWVRSSQPQQMDSLLPKDPESFRRKFQGTLPSRTADSMFWLGRYVERAQMMTRAFRATLILVNEAGNAANPVCDELYRFLAGYGIARTEEVPPEIGQVVERAFQAASSIRDRFAPDAWLTLRELREQLAALSPDTPPLSACADALRDLSAFSGLANENMYHSGGWRFLMVGMRLERALGTARLAQALGHEEAPVGSLDMLLDIADSVMTHRRRYTVAPARASVLDLVVLDPENPRSVAFQINSLKAQIAALPRPLRASSEEGPDAALARLAADLATAEASRADQPFLAQLAWRLMQISDALALSYFTGVGETQHALDALA